MADAKISDLAALSSAAVNDLLVAVDVSDTSMAASGTDKKLSVSGLGAGLVSLALVDAPGAAAAAQAASQPLDADLTTIAGLTATTDNMIQSVGSAWASRTPAQVKAALVIAESDVTNLTTDLTDLQTQTALVLAKLNGAVQSFAGYYVVSGLALSPNATPTKLDMASGVAFFNTTELTCAAQTAITPGAGASKDTIAELADATNPKWVVVELDSSKVVQYNEGTAAVAPVFPTFTATRAILGFLYVPANATNVDTALTTSNGNVKLIDARIVRPSRARLFHVDRTSKAIASANMGALSSIMTAAPSIPADSLQVGDTFVVELGGAWTQNSAGTQTFEIKMTVGSTTVFDYTSGALAASVTARRWVARTVLACESVGATGKFLFAGNYALGPPSSATAVTFPDEAGIVGRITGNIDTTAANVLDVQVKSSSTTNQAHTLGLVTIQKIPAS